MGNAKKTNVGLKQLHLKMIGLFVLVLITFEFLIGLFFVNHFSAGIEAVRSSEFKHALEKYIQKSKQIHESKLTGYAWWNELAQAITAHDNQYIKRAFIDDASLSSEYDVVELVRGDLVHQWSLIDNNDLTAFYNSRPDNREMTLKKEFLKHSNKAYRNMLAKLKISPNRASWPSLKKPIAWHYLTEYKGKVRLLTVAPICDNRGNPYAKGFMVLGTDLKRILDDAQVVIPISIVTAKHDKMDQGIKRDSASLLLPGFNASEWFLLTLVPKVSIKKMANLSFYIFILVQIILSVIIFSIISPRFTRKYTEELRHTIAERTEELRQTYEELRYTQGTLEAVTGLLPICSNCKRIRVEEDGWEQVENYIRDHSEVEFSHSICPDCAMKLYGVDIQKDD